MTTRLVDTKKNCGFVPWSRLIPIAVIAISVAIGLWWFLFSGHEIATNLVTAAAPRVRQNAVPSAEPGQVQELDVGQLNIEARKAMSEQRIVAPVGNNALEYYLRILAKESDNSGAKDALRELFPFATGNVEQAISQGNLEEANRIINLLAKADPSNYTLTILRSKFDLKKKQIEREQQQAQLAVATTRPPVPTKPPATETTTAATVKPVTSAPSNPQNTPLPASTPSDTASPAVITAAPTSAPPQTQPQGESRDVELVRQVPPDYPVPALRNRQQGWVEVEFTVNTQGAVHNVKVVRSDPPRVFDREAMRAVERWTFKPKLEKGTPVNANVHRRIEFKL